MQNQLFEAALGVAKPWYVNAVDFDTGKKTLTIRIDFVGGTRFPAAGVVGEHPVHDTQIKRMIPTATRSNPHAPNRACRWIVSCLAPV